MAADEPPGQATVSMPDDPTLVASAVRAGIDALLAERAPAERDAFWRAVALYYAPPPKHREPSEPQTKHADQETVR